MSICSITTIVERAESAPVSSPIIVFIQSNNELDCVFADTIGSRCRARNPHHKVVGIFDRTDSKDEIKEKLFKAKK